MKREKNRLKSYELWLKHAQSDLNIAEIDQEGILFELRCFHAQQAVEKSLKAILIAHKKEISKTHRIDQIIHQLSKVIEIPSFVNAAEYLTEYATDLRYPSDYGILSRDEWKEAIKIARQIVEWVEGIISEIKIKGQQL